MKKFSRRTFFYVSLALAVVLFAAVNIVSNMWLSGARLDLTETGVYTVSPGTRATLQKLQEPVTLRFFFSRDAATGYPTVTAYANRVRDLLREYVALANGKLIYQEVDPEPFTPDEDEAVAAGLTGAPTAQGSSVYFGLAATNTVNGREVIPFFANDREEYLEYDLTSLISKLANTQKPKLGILSPLPLATGPGGMMAALQGNAQPLVIYSQLGEIFEVQNIPQTADRIPPDVGALLVAHPAGLSDRTLYAIDQFVLRGGRAIVMVDPVSELAGATQGGMGGEATPATSDAAPLFRAWGIDYDPTKVVGDAQLAQRVRFGNPNRPQTLDYLVWLKLTPQFMANGDPVTANLNAINLASAGALKPAAGATTKFLPLLSSSANSALIDAARVRATQDPAELLRGFQAQGGGFTLAARVSGPVRSAFPQGAPPVPPPVAGAAPEPAPAPLPAHIGQAENANLIVVADTDLLDDRFWVEVQNLMGQRIATPLADNGAFIVNAVENMLGSNDLISLRTRAPAQRDFTVVNEIQREAEARYLAEEQQLQQRITQTETQLRALQGQNAPGAEPGAEPALSPEQQATVERFRGELVQSRAALRAVQANLRRDVEALGNTIAFLNVAVVPLLVTLTAFGLALWRRRRRLRLRGV